MRRLTLSVMLLVAATAGAIAKSVIFTLADGEKVYYLLGGTKDPMMKFQDGKMTVNADTYEFSGIKNFYISDEDDPVAIEDLLASRNISYHDGMVVVNAPDVKRVAVEAISGAAVEADVVKAGDVVTVSLSASAMTARADTALLQARLQASSMDTGLPLMGMYAEMAVRQPSIQS